MQPLDHRSNNFDFLRFLLATLVIFSHSYALSPSANDASDIISRITFHQLDGGSLAVDGFFILSGFLITKSWLRSQGLLDYLLRRASRIYPGFLSAVTFCAFVVGPLASARPYEYWGHFSPGRFLIGIINLEGANTPPVFMTNPYKGAINGSLWTIRYEFLCYIFVATLGITRILGQGKRIVVLLIFLVSLLLYALKNYLGIILETHVQILGSMDLWPGLMTCFLSGSLFYLYRDSVKYCGLYACLAILGLVILSAIPRIQSLTLALPVLWGYVLLYVAFIPSDRFHRFARRGDLSYGLYLYAFPVQQLLVLWFDGKLHPLTLFALAFLITGFLAAMSWRFVEEPFLRRVREFRSRRWMTAPAPQPDLPNRLGQPDPYLA